MANRLLVPQVTEKDWNRFMAKVEKHPNGCWNWVGAKFTQGYGMFILDGKQRRAHRVLYAWLNGEPNEGLDHICDNKACVNPQHLRPLSSRENILRGSGPTALNSVKTHCVNGHKLDYKDPRGWRGCRSCRKEAVKKHRRKLANAKKQYSSSYSS